MALLVGPETFTGTNGDPWPATFTSGLTPTGGSATIQGNAGQLVCGTTGGYAGASRVARAVTLAAGADRVIDCRVRWPAGDECYPLVFVRSPNTTLDGAGGYTAALSRPTSRINVSRTVSFTGTQLGGPSQVYNFGLTWSRVIFGAVGQNIKLLVWPDGTEQPGMWQYDVWDTALTTGSIGFSVGVGNLGNGAFEVDDVSVYDQFPDLPNTLFYAGHFLPPPGGGLGKSLWIPSPSQYPLEADVPAGSRAATGSAPVGVGAAAGVVKVVAVAARAGLGFGGAGAAGKRAPAAGVSAVGLSATGTARKTAPAAGLAALGLAGTGAGRKVGVAAGRAAAGLAAAGTTRTVRAAAGSAALGFAAGMSSSPARAVLARVGLGWSATGSTVKRSPAVTSSALGLSSASTARTSRPVLARAVTGQQAAGTSGKRTPVTGRAGAGLIAGAVARRVAAATGRVLAGFRASTEAEAELHRPGTLTGRMEQATGLTGGTGSGATMTGTADSGSSLIGSIE